MIFFDTEGCGFYGPTTLIQYAYDDGPVYLHSVFTTPVHETLELIEELCYHDEGVVGFNLAFDWFHMCQTYTTLSLYKNRNAHPEDDLNLYAEYEKQGRSGLCLKPKKALDLMLHARKGPYQSTMNRGDIRIKRVPTALAWELVGELNTRIPLKDVYFARRKDKTVRWQVFDVHNDLGDMVPDFKDVVLKFSPSSALKALCVDAGISKEKRLLFSDIDLPDKAKAFELGYAPYALAPFIDKVTKKVCYPGPNNWYKKWPEVIHMHISHWAYNSMAREYAEDDVHDTRALYHYFDKPELDDDDSVLACMVGTVRWKGFKIDSEGLKKLKSKRVKFLATRKFNFNAPAVCKTYLYQVMDETERVVVQGSTKASVLEVISKWMEQTVCEDCGGMGCHKCDDGLISSNVVHPAAERAQEILDARHAKKEIENYDKLLLADRFHASFNVIGTLSSRMSGADGLNAQGIKNERTIRECFPLSDSDTVLCGGDFAGFEVGLMDACYGDPKLRDELLTGKKIHALFGAELFELSYDEVMASKDLPLSDPCAYYARAKRGVFALAFGGEAYTLSDRVGIPELQAEEAYQRWIKKYVVWGEARKAIFDKFCSMKQPNGIGTAVEWHEPADYTESMLGFRRYFTLENNICRTLFQLAEKPPKDWIDIKIKVTRRDREQTVTGASRSALFAAAFTLQASNMRAAANHEIQSTGAQLTKGLQRNIWDIQPPGINRWRVQPMNIHDEIMCPTQPMYKDEVTRVQQQFVEDNLKLVPLLAIDWGCNLTSWASK